MIYIDDNKGEVTFTPTQKDDGNRNALNHFMSAREMKAASVIAFCAKHGEFWKARVFLELLWEYEKRETPPTGGG